MKKIAILGGTFSPIHRGHLLMAETALAYGMDEVWFVPSGVSYFKEGTGVIAADKRLKMVQLATAYRTEFVVSAIEIERGGNSYTYETMEAFNKMYPNCTFYFMLGADSLYALETWKYPERILRACDLLTVVREDISHDALLAKIEELKKTFGGQVHLLPMPNTDVSSTEIRCFYQKGGKHHRDVPPEVDEYILSNHLYVE